MEPLSTFILRRRVIVRAWLRLGQVLLTLRTLIADYVQYQQAQTFYPGNQYVTASTVDWIGVVLITAAVHAWLLLAAAGLLLVERKLLAWIIPVHPGACPACGHDASGLARCPECGLDLARPEPPARGA